MNHHGLLDIATVRLGSALLGDDRFFAQSLETEPIGTVVADSMATVKSSLPATEGPQSVRVETPAGPYRAGYQVLDWKRASLPTLLFHHGSGEDPFATGRFSTNSVSRIFGNSESVPANIIAVRAPFHDGSTSDYARAMGDLADFGGMLGAATSLIEALRERLNETGSPAVIISGISLGGWVTNLHRAFEDSAECYAPLFGGDRLGEMFVSSAYSRMTGSLAQDHPETLRETLDFPDAFAIATAPLRPILGRYDRIIELEAQAPAYSDTELKVIEYGHVTGSLQSGLLRDHLLDAVVEAPGRH